ncbi:hypothetical protein D1007_38201 [Hordeum vulgare]|nr:hypothetical protein D1007_38201 [Hordeum vulgare]
MEFSVHHVDTHLRNTNLTVVYTDDPTMVENSINTMERLLAVDDKYKVVGLDLVYTDGRDGHDQKVVVTHLCVCHHILLYQYFRDTKPCDHFTRFVNRPNYRFATADTTNDPKVLKTSGLACQKLVDIHDHYKDRGSKKDKDSHVDLVVAIIDPYYRHMKAECDKNKLVWHRALLKRLDKYHFQTAAKEAYTWYEIFTQIIDMRKCLLAEDNEGSSRKQSGWRQASQEVDDLMIVSHSLLCM